MLTPFKEQCSTRDTCSVGITFQLCNPHALHTGGMTCLTLTPQLQQLVYRATAHQLHTHLASVKCKQCGTRLSGPTPYSQLGIQSRTMKLLHINLKQKSMQYQYGTIKRFNSWEFSQPSLMFADYVSKVSDKKCISISLKYKIFIQYVIM